MALFSWQGPTRGLYMLLSGLDFLGDPTVVTLTKRETCDQIKQLISKEPTLTTIGEVLSLEEMAQFFPQLLSELDLEENYQGEIVPFTDETKGQTINAIKSGDIYLFPYLEKENWVADIINQLNPAPHWGLLFRQEESLCFFDSINMTVASEKFSERQWEMSDCYANSGCQGFIDQDIQNNRLLAGTFFSWKKYASWVQVLLFFYHPLNILLFFSFFMVGGKLLTDYAASVMLTINTALDTHLPTYFLGVCYFLLIILWIISSCLKRYVKIMKRSARLSTVKAPNEAISNDRLVGKAFKISKKECD